MESESQSCVGFLPKKNSRVKCMNCSRHKDEHNSAFISPMVQQDFTPLKKIPPPRPKTPPNPQYKSAPDLSIDKRWSRNRDEGQGSTTPQSKGSISRRRALSPAPVKPQRTESHKAKHQPLRNIVRKAHSPKHGTLSESKSETTNTTNNSDCKDVVGSGSEAMKPPTPVSRLSRSKDVKTARQSTSKRSDNNLSHAKATPPRNFNQLKRRAPTPVRNPAKKNETAPMPVINTAKETETGVCSNDPGDEVLSAENEILQQKIAALSTQLKYMDHKAKSASTPSSDKSASSSHMKDIQDDRINPNPPAVRFDLENVVVINECISRFVFEYLSSSEDDYFSQSDEDNDSESNAVFDEQFNDSGELCPTHTASDQENHTASNSDLHLENQSLASVKEATTGADPEIHDVQEVTLTPTFESQVTSYPENEPGLSRAEDDRISDEWPPPPSDVGEFFDDLSRNGDVTETNQKHIKEDAVPVRQHRRSKSPAPVPPSVMVPKMTQMALRMDSRKYLQDADTQQAVNMSQDIRSRKKSSAPPAARTSRKSHSTDRDPNRKSKKMPPAKGFFKSLLKKGKSKTDLTQPEYDPNPPRQIQSDTEEIPHDDDPHDEPEDDGKLTKEFLDTWVSSTTHQLMEEMDYALKGVWPYDKKEDSSYTRRKSITPDDHDVIEVLGSPDQTTLKRKTKKPTSPWSSDERASADESSNFILKEKTKKYNKNSATASLKSQYRSQPSLSAAPHHSSSTALSRTGGKKAAPPSEHNQNRRASRGSIPDEEENIIPNTKYREEFLAKIQKEEKNGNRNKEAKRHSITQEANIASATLTRKKNKSSAPELTVLNTQPAESKSPVSSILKNGSTAGSSDKGSVSKSKKNPAPVAVAAHGRQSSVPSSTYSGSSSSGEWRPKDEGKTSPSTFNPHDSGYESGTVRSRYGITPSTSRESTGYESATLLRPKNKGLASANKLTESSFDISGTAQKPRRSEGLSASSDFATLKRVKKSPTLSLQSKPTQKTTAGVSAIDSIPLCFEQLVNLNAATLQQLCAAYVQSQKAMDLPPVGDIRWHDIVVVDELSPLFSSTKLVLYKARWRQAQEEVFTVMLSLKPPSSFSAFKPNILRTDMTFESNVAPHLIPDSLYVGKKQMKLKNVVNAVTALKMGGLAKITSANTPESSVSPAKVEHNRNSSIPALEEPKRTSTPVYKSQRSVDDVLMNKKPAQEKMTRLSMISVPSTSARDSVLTQDSVDSVESAQEEMDAVDSILEAIADEDAADSPMPARSNKSEPASVKLDTKPSVVALAKKFADAKPEAPPQKQADRKSAQKLKVPEVKVEEHKEVKTEAKPEVRAEVKPVEKPNAKVDVLKSVETEAKPEEKLVTKPTTQMANKAEASKAVEAEAKPDMKPEEKPVATPTAQPEIKKAEASKPVEPEVKSKVKSEQKAVAQPTENMEIKAEVPKEAEKHVETTDAKPLSKPATEVEKKTEANEEVKPVKDEAEVKVEPEVRPVDNQEISTDGIAESQNEKSQPTKLISEENTSVKEEKKPPVKVDEVKIEVLEKTTDSKGTSEVKQEVTPEEAAAPIPSTTETDQATEPQVVGCEQTSDPETKVEVSDKQEESIPNTAAEDRVSKQEDVENTNTSTSPADTNKVSPAVSPVQVRKSKYAEPVVPRLDENKNFDDLPMIPRTNRRANSRTFNDIPQLAEIKIRPNRGVNTGKAMSIADKFNPSKKPERGVDKILPTLRTSGAVKNRIANLNSSNNNNNADLNSNNNNNNSDGYSDTDDDYYVDPAEESEHNHADLNTNNNNNFDDVIASSSGGEFVFANHLLEMAGGDMYPPQQGAEAEEEDTTVAAPRGASGLPRCADRAAPTQNVTCNVTILPHMNQVESIKTYLERLKTENRETTDLEMDVIFILLQVLNIVFGLSDSQLRLESISTNDFFIVTDQNDVATLHCHNVNVTGATSQKVGLTCEKLRMFLMQVSHSTPSLQKSVIFTTVDDMVQNAEDLGDLRTIAAILQYLLWGPKEDEVKIITLAEHRRQAFELWLHLARAKLVSGLALKPIDNLKAFMVTNFLANTNGTELFKITKLLNTY